MKVAACVLQVAANRIPERNKSRIIAEWSGKRVTLYADSKIQFRQINVPHNVVGVQVSGDSRTDAMVSIAMDNGRTWLYKSSGTLVRQ